MKFREMDSLITVSLYSDYIEQKLFHFIGQWLYSELYSDYFLVGNKIQQRGENHTKLNGVLGCWDVLSLDSTMLSGQVDTS